MFKRLEKRRQRKEDADRLGVDEQWQDILGFHDTDSEESTSEETEQNNETSSDNEGSIDYPEDEDGEDQESQITVGQALVNPLYVASSFQPEVMACIICPGKVLKGPKMEELHLASNAHVRRFKHFSRLAADAEPTESAQKLFKSIAERALDTDSTTATSKRAEKRKIYLARQKERRAKLKDRRKKAEQAVLSALGPIEPKTSTPDKKKRLITSGDLPKAEEEPTSPGKKKRKVIESYETAGPSETQPSSKKQKSAVKTKQKESTKNSRESDEKRSMKEMATGIVRSTTDRAKKARLKAVSSSKDSTSKHSKLSKHLL